VETLLSLAEPWAYVVIALLSAAESGAMVGLFLPGETIMLLGGVLVFEGRAEAVPMIAAAWLGGVAGDCLSFFLGRRLGPRLRRSRLGRKIGEDRWRRAEDYLAERGSRAVFVGRFIGVFRALLPAVAGSGGMSFRTYILADAPAALLFGGGFVLLGVAAGGSWRVIDEWAGRAGLVVLLVLVIAVVTYLLVRWAGRNRERFISAVRRLPLVERTLERYSSELTALKRRYGPGGYGLLLAGTGVVALAGGVLFGQLIDEVIEGSEIRPIDGRIAGFFTTHRDPGVTGAAEILRWLGDPLFGAVALALIAALGFRREREPRVVLCVIASTAALGISWAVRALVDRSGPPGTLVDGSGPSFPSPIATAAAVVLICGAFVSSRGRPWRTGVAAWGIALPASLLVAIGEIYLGAAWPSDAAAGLLLGGVWTLVCWSALDLLPRARPSRA
jgi:undecaprenyl-diphosphatase